VELLVLLLSVNDYCLLGGDVPRQRRECGQAAQRQDPPGSPWLRQALVEAAPGSRRTNDTYLAAQYQRLVSLMTRRGKKKAVVAVGHTILVNVNYLLVRGGDYQDLGCAYFDERDRAAVQRRLVRRLEALGHAVQLQPVAPQWPRASFQTRFEPMSVFWTAVEFGHQG
jgi:hypothetical protein